MIENLTNNAIAVNKAPKPYYPSGEECIFLCFFLFIDKKERKASPVLAQN